MVGFRTQYIIRGEIRYRQYSGITGLSRSLAVPRKDWLPCQAFEGLTALLLSVVNELTLYFQSPLRLIQPAPSVTLLAVHIFHKKQGDVSHGVDLADIKLLHNLALIP